MAVMKHPSGTYSTWLRQRRQARAQPLVITITDVIQVGDWLLADDGGDLVIVNRSTGRKILLAQAGEGD